MNAPIVLSDRISLTLSGSTAPISFDTGALINTYRDPIEIREIRTCARVSIDAPEPTVSPSMALLAVQARLKVGAHWITRDRVPIVALSSPVMPLRGREATASQGERAVIGAAAGAALRTLEMTRYALDRPFILPPGAGFSGDVFVDRSNAALLAENYSVDLDLMIVGRIASGRVPRAQSIPYVTSWLHVPGAAGTFGLSPQGVFENLLNAPLNVYRFSLFSGVTGDYASVLDYPTRGDLQITMRGEDTDSDRRREVFSDIDAADLFTQRTTWIARHVLNPREWYHLQVRALTTRIDAFVPITMIGDRMEVLS